ncbi:MAG: ribosome recycling factor [Cyclobacteriaceae bacterium]|jgi:ribosome recycling factor
MEEIEFYLDHAREMMSKAVEHTQHALTKIRAGKAMPNMLDGIEVDYYGNLTPLNQVASVTTPDARTLIIKPWEKGIIAGIEKAIINSDLGLNPQNDGDIVRLNIPMLTEERRFGLVKQAKAECESGKISIRNIRKEVNDSLKKLEKDGTSEDLVKDAEAQVQKVTDSNTAKLDEILAKKEKEIMTL